MIEQLNGYIDKKALFAVISDYDIFKKYLGYDFKLKKNYYSPFRIERTPSFGMFMGQGGEIFFKDLGGDGYAGDCIKFVALLFNLSYYQAIRKIVDDLGCEITPLMDDTQSLPARTENKETPLIQIIPNRWFLSEERKYWNRYGISTDDLEKENVYSVKHLFISKKKISIPSSMVFAYHYSLTGNDFLKIYQPYSNLHKWYSNVPVKRAIGLEKLAHKSNVVVVAKSKKDKIVLSKLLTDVYEAQKEGPEVISDELNDHFDQHYDRKVIFFDNDKTGIKSASTLIRRGFDSVRIPIQYLQEKIKDASDLVASYGYRPLEFLLHSRQIVLKTAYI